MLDSVQYCRRISCHFRSAVSENGDASARRWHPYPIQAFLNAIHLDDVAISSKWSSDRITRHSENALLRATQAGSLLRVHHRRIGRSRLPADSACPGRAIDPHQIRADHAAFSGFHSTFSGPRVKEFLVTSSMPPTPASVAESRSAQEWLRPGCELRGRSLHRRMRIGKPNA